MADIYFIAKSTLTQFGDIARDCAKISSAYTPTAMIETINNYLNNQTNFLDEDLDKFYNSKIENIRAYGLYKHTKIADVSIPACKTIGKEAFLENTALTKLYAPKCNTIGKDAFKSCTTLKDVTLGLSAITYVDEDKQWSHRLIQDGLVQIKFPDCTNIADGASVAKGAFYNYDHIQSVDFSMCSQIGKYAFNNCTVLSTISFPKCKTIKEQAFQSCAALTTVSLPQCETIAALAFQSCAKLTDVYLTGSSMCKIANKNVFANTPISESGIGQIWVAPSLASIYKNDSIWSVYSSKIQDFNQA